MELTEAQRDEAVIIFLPAVVKAGHGGAARRLVEIEASNEYRDLDGDVVLQKALLDSAESFVATGHLDIEHISELGILWNIADPSSYIVGRPLEVSDLGDGRTGVVGELRKAKDGNHNPQRNRYDEFWDSLQSSPPVAWQASVFGYPKAGMVDDCRKGDCGGATRFLIRGFDWRSLAFTRQPRNHMLKGTARIVNAKAFAKSSPFAAIPSVAPYSTVEDLWNERWCGKCGAEEFPTTAAYRMHFEKYRGMAPGQADIFAHALMHRLNKARMAGENFRISV